MTATFAADSAGSPERAWALIARPELWRHWSPHLRGARGLGTPEVEPGHSGWVEVLGAPLVPVTILDKDPGRSWRWKIGPVEMDHRVEPRDGGCRVAVDIEAPAPVETVVRLTYGPLVALLVRNLARVAGLTRGRPPGR
jgi:hypothetical protein